MAASRRSNRLLQRVRRHANLSVLFRREATAAADPLRTTYAGQSVNGIAITRATTLPGFVNGAPAGQLPFGSIVSLTQLTAAHEPAEGLQRRIADAEQYNSAAGVPFPSQSITTNTPAALPPISRAESPLVRDPQQLPGVTSRPSYPIAASQQPIAQRQIEQPGVQTSPAPQLASGQIQATTESNPQHFQATVPPTYQPQTPSQPVGGSAQPTVQRLADQPGADSPVSLPPEQSLQRQGDVAAAPTVQQPQSMPASNSPGPVNIPPTSASQPFAAQPRDPAQPPQLASSDPVQRATEPAPSAPTAPSAAPAPRIDPTSMFPTSDPNASIEDPGVWSRLSNIMRSHEAKPADAPKTQAQPQASWLRESFAEHQNRQQRSVRRKSEKKSPEVQQDIERPIKPRGQRRSEFTYLTDKDVVPSIPIPGTASPTPGKSETSVQRQPGEIAVSPEATPAAGEPAGIESDSVELETTARQTSVVSDSVASDASPVQRHIEGGPEKNVAASDTPAIPANRSDTSESRQSDTVEHTISATSSQAPPDLASVISRAESAPAEAVSDTPQPHIQRAESAERNEAMKAAAPELAEVPTVVSPQVVEPSESEATEVRSMPAGPQHLPAAANQPLTETTTTPVAPPEQAISTAEAPSTATAEIGASGPGAVVKRAEEVTSPTVQDGSTAQTEAAIAISGETIQRAPEFVAPVRATVPQQSFDPAPTTAAAEAETTAAVPTETFVPAPAESERPETSAPEAGSIVTEPVRSATKAFQPLQRQLNDPLPAVNEPSPVAAMTHQDTPPLATPDVQRAVETPAAPVDNRPSLESIWPVEHLSQGSGEDGEYVPPPLQPPALRLDKEAETIRRALADVDTGEGSRAKIDLQLPRRPRRRPAAPAQPIPASPPPAAPDSPQNSVATFSPQVATNAPTMTPTAPAGLQRAVAVEVTETADLAAEPFVETDVGALPSDLWGYLGETAPADSDTKATESNKNNLMRFFDTGSSAQAEMSDVVPPRVQREIEIRDVNSRVEQRPAEAPAEETEAAEPDIDALAEKVYADLKRRLRLEWERTRGRFR